MCKKEIKECEVCKSQDLEEEKKNMSSDNILVIYKCKSCGHKKTELEHIG
jgi:SepF-like predicted cell division protein (DUF552 family)